MSLRVCSHLHVIEGFLPYTVCVMNGTAAMDATRATEKTISASLNRHGKRFVQCLVRSKKDITITLLMFQICFGYPVQIYLTT